MKKITVICDRYPNVNYPADHVFVQQLVWAIADLGIECTVICPIPINQKWKSRKLLKQTIEKTSNNSVINLRFPKYISFGQKNILGLNSVHLTTFLFTKCVDKQMNAINMKPDVLYGHFLAPAGVCVSRMAKKYDIPGFAAFGESTPWSINHFGKHKIANELKQLRGIVSVSTENKQILKNLNLYREDDIEVFPNAIQSSRFYPRDKKEARQKFGFDNDVFIVAFVGRFNHRKGVMRVKKALEDLKDIGIAYAGQGKENPESENMIYCDVVKPEDMPFFLSAADVFVLPTLNEGCCNAIIEAMACGLPIVSSDLPCNYDIVSEDNARLIDPENVQEIRDAIMLLHDNRELRKNMAKASLNKANKLTIEKRARNIIAWIDKQINANN